MENTKQFNDMPWDSVTCIGCANVIPENEAANDDAGENYCGPCWEVFEPLLAEEYRELVEKGEIEPEYTEGELRENVEAARKHWLGDFVHDRDATEVKQEFGWRPKNK